MQSNIDNSKNIEEFIENLSLISQFLIEKSHNI